MESTENNVSEYIKETFPKILSDKLDKLFMEITPDQTVGSEKVNAVLTETFHEVNTGLYNCTFDIKLSGSTCIM